MSPSQPSATPSGEVQEEDDYLTMTFAEPSSPTTTTTSKKESLTQATKRKQREAEIRAHPKSKAELAAEEASKRDAALARSTLNPSSKGFQMLAKLGYKPGSALGKGKLDGDTDQDGGGGDDAAAAGLLEPLRVEMKEGRSGIGADAEKKRKFKEEAEARVRVEGEERKRQKVELGEFRERQRLEREERRRYGQVVGAQKVAERLEEEEEEEGEKGRGESSGLEDRNRVGTGKKRKSKPLSQINVLWRGAVKQREIAERDKRMRYDLHQSLSRLPTYEDADEDEEDKMALRKRDTEEVDLGLDQEDLELDEFDALETSDKLQMLVQYLRDRWHYCFWCKYRYGDSKMEGCPGSTEEDHD